MSRLFGNLSRTLLALWTGAMASVAFVVAPAVFRRLDDPALAGSIMAGIFRKVDLFGVFASLLFALAARRNPVRALAGAALAAGALLSVLLIAPKVNAGGTDLEFWHRIAEGLWGLLLLGSLLLALLGPGARKHDG